MQEGSFVLVGNGRLYGGPFPFFKQAVVDDGLLDVVLFKRLGFLEILKYLHDVVFSSDIRVPEIEYFQTRQLRVSSEQDVPVELDGELAGNCPVDFQMHEKALPVLASSIVVALVRALGQLVFRPESRDVLRNGSPSGLDWEKSSRIAEPFTGRDDVGSA